MIPEYQHYCDAAAKQVHASEKIWYVLFQDFVVSMMRKDI